MRSLIRRILFEELNQEPSDDLYSKGKEYLQSNFNEVRTLKQFKEKNLDLFNELIDGGLLRQLAQEFYFDELKLIYNKIEFIKDPNPAIGNECDILNKMHDTYLDLDNNHKICYFHTKGFSYNPLPAPIANWIRYSDLHIINHWVERLQELENNDVSGGWLFKPDEETRKFGEPDNRKTFAGHFWWANSSYLKTLEPLTK